MSNENPEVLAPAIQKKDQHPGYMPEHVLLPNGIDLHRGHPNDEQLEAIRKATLVSDPSAVPHLPHSGITDLDRAQAMIVQLEERLADVNANKV